MGKKLKERIPDGHQWCSQCESILPETAFWKPKANRLNARVVICSPCAETNMAAWSRTQNVGLKPEDITAVE